MDPLNREGYFPTLGSACTRPELNQSPYQDPKEVAQASVVPTTLDEEARGKLQSGI